MGSGCFESWDSAHPTLKINKILPDSKYSNVLSQNAVSIKELMAEINAPLKSSIDCFFSLTFDKFRKT